MQQFKGGDFLKVTKDSCKQSRNHINNNKRNKWTIDVINTDATAIVNVIF